MRTQAGSTNGIRIDFRFFVLPVILYICNYALGSNHRSYPNSIISYTKIYLIIYVIMLALWLDTKSFMNVKWLAPPPHCLSVRERLFPSLSSAEPVSFLGLGWSGSERQQSLKLGGGKQSVGGFLLEGRNIRRGRNTRARLSHTREAHVDLLLL